MIDVGIVIVCSHHSKTQSIFCYVHKYDVCWLQSVNPSIEMWIR